MSDNAEILTAACAAIERYRSDERALEVEIAILQTRLELVREFLSALSGKPRSRRGRPPKVDQVADPIETFEEVAA